MRLGTALVLGALFILGSFHHDSHKTVGKRAELLFPGLAINRLVKLSAP